MSRVRSLYLQPAVCHSLVDGQNDLILGIEHDHLVLLCHKN